MGRVSVLIAALALLVAGSAAAQDPMRAFSPPNGRFTVMMPGTPQSESAPLTQTNGKTTTSHRFWSSPDNDSVAYMLTYSDDTEPQVMPGRLEIARDELLQTSPATLLSDRVISLNGIPGRAYTARGTDDGVLYDMQIYYAGRRLYQLITLTSPGNTAPFRDAFMSSFRILSQQ